eukprot:TRINITY_DN879_c0_g1_i1.p1 TRINITY_DN879_c0_g1~~TRINITY_DN879_c0_g1_i1.p1  ORF type:complete len:260 (-),score=59.60 TRINITY_DN879_c0_g1_i1:363-1142(-)
MLTKKEYEEKIIQMDVLFEKKLRDEALKYENAIYQKEKECQEKIDISNVATKEKLAHYSKTMEEEMNALNVQHQYALEKLINENKIEQSKLNAQVKDKNIELRQIKEESAVVVSKLNQELKHATIEHESSKNKYLTKIHFLKITLKLQSLLERQRFDTSKKTWEKEFRESQQLLEVVQASLEKEKFLNKQKCKELYEIQQMKEKDKKEMTMEIKALMESNKDQVLKLECEREVERKQYLEKAMVDNANQQEMRARTKKI